MLFRSKREEGREKREERREKREEREERREKREEREERSEERRVGKECRSRRWRYHSKKQDTRARKGGPVECYRLHYLPTADPKVTSNTHPTLISLILVSASTD